MPDSLLKKLHIYEAVVEYSSDAVIVAEAYTDKNDDEGPLILYVNDAYSLITGFSANEVIGQKLSFIQGGIENDNFKSILNNINREQYYATQIRSIAKNGIEKWLSMALYPVPDDNGKIINYAAILRDITKEKDFEEKLRRAKEESERANKAKTEFLANMSHELRTPMNSIMGMTEIIIEDSVLDDESRDMMKTVYRSSANLLAILNDVLDISKIEAGGMELEYIPFDLEDIVFNTVNGLKPLASEKGLLVTSTIENKKDIPYFRGDPTRLSRILTNLVGNASKYTEKGYVKVTARIREKDELHRIVEIEVSDTGIGIEADKKYVIFEKFAQADSSITRKYGGTGLGLAITKQLVDIMGGTITLESEVGKGSVFKVVLPFEIADKVTENENDPLVFDMNKVAKTRTPVEEARLIVAEDHPFNQAFIKKLLRRMGFKNFELVENGQEAVNKVEAGDYDMLLMDCQMPVLSGYDAAKTIRKLKDETKRNIPIIAMTANAMLGERERCLQCGMNEYMSKPVNLKQTKMVLGHWIIFPSEDIRQQGSQMILNNSKAPVDLSMIESFSDGDEDVKKELAGLFLEQTDLNMDTLSKNCIDGECVIWSETAHMVKGSAANIGAEELRALSEKAQFMKEANSNERKKIFEEMDAVYKDVKTYINKNILQA